MISLRLKHSPLVEEQLDIFEQKLQIAEIQMLERSLHLDKGTIKYVLKGNSPEIIIKIVSLAEDLFYPYLLGYTAHNEKRRWVLNRRGGCLTKSVSTLYQYAL